MVCAARPIASTLLRRRDPHALAASRRERERAVRVVVGVAPHGHLRAQIVASIVADFGGAREADPRRAEAHEDAAYVGGFDAPIEDFDLVNEVAERDALGRQAEQPGGSLLRDAVGEIEHRDRGAGVRLVARPVGLRGEPSAAALRTRPPRTEEERSSRRAPLHGLDSSTRGGGASCFAVSAGAGHGGARCPLDALLHVGRIRSLGEAIGDVPIAARGPGSIAARPLVSARPSSAGRYDGLTAIARL